MKRVAYVTVPYLGHSSVLLQEWTSNHDSHLILLCFSDDTLPTAAIQEENDNRSVVTVLKTRIARPSECAAVFNQARYDLLKDVVHCVLAEFSPELVVYDFFCLEAREAARKLGVPAVCSVPALLKSTETDTCSDGILPREHMYWIWKHPYSVALKEPVRFLGPRVPLSLPFIPNMYDFVGGDRLIYVCFGTVVPRYPNCRDQIYKILLEIAQATDYVFVLINLTDYAHVFADDSCSHVHLVPYVDLQQLFGAFPPVAFIFHGGGNSYSEAVAHDVRCLLVCPFFGDQFETARVVGNQYEEGKLVDGIQYALRHPVPKPNPIVDTQYEDFSDFFCQGDLVFGHSRHRRALQERFPSIDLHLEHFANFDTFACPQDGHLPAIADVYNDEQQQQQQGEEHIPYYARLKEFRASRHFHLPSTGCEEDEHCLVYYCLQLLMLTVEKWHNKIHFVLGPMEELGKATQIELDFVKKNWARLKDAVIFYNLQGIRIPAPFFVRERKIRKEAFEGSMLLVSHLELFALSPFVEGRAKSALSVADKIERRGLPVLDYFAFRTGYIDNRDLEVAQQRLPHAGAWDVCVTWGDLRVHFYYYLKMGVEVQLWPWVYLHNFHRDQRQEEKTNRLKQREIQDKIEK